MVTVAVLLSTVPSFALNVNESGPVYPAAGVYVREGPPGVDGDRVPCNGCVTIECVSGLLLGSVAVRVMGVAVLVGNYRPS